MNFSKQFINQPGNLCNTKRYVAKLDTNFNVVGIFDIPEEVCFRHCHPDKDVVIIGEIQKKDEKKIVTLQIIRGQHVYKKRLDGICDSYADAHFSSPNPWIDDKYVFVAEKHIEGLNEYRETFGEKFEGKSDPVIGIYDYESDQLDFIELDYYPMSPSFVNSDTLMLQIYPKSELKLGINYCLNRPTQVALLDVHSKEISVISDKSKSARSPRVVNGQVYFLQGPLYYSHFPAANVIAYDPVTKQSSLVAGQHFEETLKPHVNAAALVMNPSVKVMQRITTCNDVLENDAELLGVFGDVCFYKKSSVKSFPSLHVLYLHKKEPLCILSQKALPEMNLIGKEVISMSPTFDILIYKKKGNEKLILMPHGGPNSRISDTFSVAINYFLVCGYDFGRVNYTGSAGYNQAAIEKLVIGQHEIEDTLQGALKFKPLYKKMAIYSGSHGGFIIGTMLGKYPDLFDAAAVVNPVIDLPSMLATSDIPDWSLGQLQLPFDLHSIYNPEVLKKVSEATPGRYAKDIVAPILFMLGIKDRRVPPSQGLFWKKLCHGKDFTLKFYDDSDHSLDSEKSLFDVPLQIISFFNEKLEK